MLVVGAHPTLAMHFCGGKLHSVDFVSDRAETSCCSGMMKDMPQENDQLCIAETSSSDNIQLSNTHNGCCNTQKIQISTDNYRHQSQQLNVANILPSFDNIWFTLNYMSISQSVESDNLTIVKHTFPPEGLDKQNIDLLTYICIYRI